MAPQRERAADESESRAALLIIHGIGEQRPFQPLDAFTRGLANRLQLPARTLEHVLVWRDGGTASALRLPLAEPLGRPGFRTLDVYELYWAGLVQGRIRLRQVLIWLAKTSLTPLRLWSRQAPILFRERGGFRAPLAVFLRELGRSALLLAAAALIIGLFVAAAWQGDALLQAGQRIRSVAAGVEHPVLLLLWVALVFFALMLARGWWQMLRQRIRYRTSLSRQSRMEQEATRWWLRASAVAFLVLLVAAWLLHWRIGLDVPGLLAASWTAIQVRPWPVAWAVAAVVLAVGARWALIRFIGDIALYVTADERSTFFRTRAEILERSSRQLSWLLNHPDYSAVYVAGHSLGSVIAYDTLNRLMRQVRIHERGTDDAPDASVPQERDGPLGRAAWDKLRGLLTFGSPLDMIYYFFRTRVRDEEAVRAQMLASLHGFRMGASGRDYGALRLALYEIPEPEDFIWRNVWSPADPISGRLDFYRVDEQVRRRYSKPLASHMDYWNDPGFYAAVLDWL